MNSENKTPHTLDRVTPTPFPYIYMAPWVIVVIATVSCSFSAKELEKPQY